MKLRWTISGAVCTLMLLTLIFSECSFDNSPNLLAAGGKVKYFGRTASHLNAAVYYADVEGGYPYRHNTVVSPYDDTYSVVHPGKGTTPFNYKKWNRRIDFGTGPVPFVTNMGGYSSVGGAHWNGTGAHPTGAQPNRMRTLTPEQAMQSEAPVPINNVPATNQSASTTVTDEAMPQQATPQTQQGNEIQLPDLPAEQPAKQKMKAPSPDAEILRLPQAPAPKTASIQTRYNQEFVVDDGGMIYDDNPFPELGGYEPAPKKKCFISALWDKIKGTSCLSGNRWKTGCFGKSSFAYDPCFPICDPCFSCCDPCFSCCDPCFSCCDPCFPSCDPCFPSCGSFSSIGNGGGCSSCGGGEGAPLNVIPQQQLAPTKVGTPEPVQSNPAIPAQPEKSFQPATPAPGPGPAPAPKMGTTGTIQMFVPDNSIVYINGYKTKLTGSERTFTAKNLTEGESYDFEVKVICAENGQQFEQVKTTTLTPGSTRSLAFEFDNFKKMEAVALVK